MIFLHPRFRKLVSLEREKGMSEREREKGRRREEREEEKERGKIESFIKKRGENEFSL